jgi:hypothetical protein
MKTQRLKMFFSTIAVLALVVGGATGAKAQEPSIRPAYHGLPVKLQRCRLRYRERQKVVLGRSSSLERWLKQSPSNA